jgi:hypothetical protein
MYVTIFISWPLGKLLDCVLGGDHGNKRFKAHELRWLLKEHVTEALQMTQQQMIDEAVDGPEGASFSVPFGSNTNDDQENVPAGQKGITKGEFKIFLGALAL